MAEKTDDLKKRSSGVFEHIKTTPFMFVPLGIMNALGIDAKTLNSKPLIGIANSWNEINPGHAHLRELAEAVKYGIIEAAHVGGPIAALRSGDVVTIDIPARKIDVDLSSDEITSRLKDFKPFEKNIRSKTLLKYRALVTDAAHGARSNTGNRLRAIFPVFRRGGVYPRQTICTLCLLKQGGDKPRPYEILA